RLACAGACLARRVLRDLARAAVHGRHLPPRRQRPGGGVAGTAAGGGPRRRTCRAHRTGLLRRPDGSRGAQPAGRARADPRRHRRAGDAAGAVLAHAGWAAAAPPARPLRAGAVSLILEALKKSEAERRLGKAPELLSPAPVARRRHGLWPLAAAMLLAVALSTGITWWLLRPAPSPANGEVAAPAGHAAPAAAGPSPASTTVGAEEPAPPATRAAQPPAPATGTAGQMQRPPVERESAPMVAGNT